MRFFHRYCHKIPKKIHVYTNYRIIEFEKNLQFLRLFQFFDIISVDYSVSSQKLRLKLKFENVWVIAASQYVIKTFYLVKSLKGKRLSKEKLNLLYLGNGKSQKAQIW